LFRAAQAVTEHLLRAVPYDRVMVYRFCPPEMFGEVIAEARSEARPDLPPYLGLRYPSTDIPRVARTLYEVSHARATADINAMPAIMWARDEAAQPLPVPPPPPPPPPTRVRASAAAGAAVSSPSLSPSLAGAPTAERHTRIDMSFATLRYPSPSHLEYLRNMGVRASMSVSLLAPPAARDPDESPLWGLFIFHHYAERALQFRERVYLKRAGALFAEWLDRFRRASKRASGAPPRCCCRRAAAHSRSQTRGWSASDAATRRASQRRLRRRRTSARC
jgi:light-regulated signal transduction histidine kinase (bacteriophytochrome)